MLLIQMNTKLGSQARLRICLYRQTSQHDRILKWNSKYCFL